MDELEDGMADKKQQRKANKNKADLAHKAYQGIRQMLFFNEIVPGQKIKYQDLADKIGVSITPVIHALKWLEFKSIVRHEANRGYFVNEVSLKEIKEIYDTRLLLEVSLVPEIIARVDGKALNRLEIVFDEYRQSVNEENYYNRLMTDMKFHLTLASISQCQIQVRMLEELFDMLLLKYTRNLILLGIMDTSMGEHVVILKALAAEDSESLRQALSTHLDHVRHHITTGFRKMFPAKPHKMIDFLSFH
jgi:DNA-binding GntR family transcriptional regulator